MTDIRQLLKRLGPTPPRDLGITDAVAIFEEEKQRDALVVELAKPEQGPVLLSGGRRVG